MAAPLDPAEPAAPVYDIVGIGFGPSNLALAVAVAEHNLRSTADTATTAVFLERQPRFGWHRGMLIDDATMQVSFLKDLVTLRDPTSPFSFLCYLQSRGRLLDFINHKNLYPLRVEFHDYLEWAAAKVDDLVLYGHEAVALAPVVQDGVVAYVDVTARTGSRTSRYRARNLVLATGLQPHLPAGIVPSERVWHNGDLLGRVERLPGGPPERFVVVGAGQSAAEVTAFLHDRFAGAEVCAVFARYGYSPADDSSFANRIFDPAAVGEYFGAPPEVKRLMLDYHGNTNYSVVDTDLIDDLYHRVYQEKVLGTERLRLFNVSRLTAAEETGTGVRATIESLITGRRTVLDADAVVCATGYRPADPLPLLGPLARHCRRDDLGRPAVERDYRLCTGPDLRCGIYLQGGTEHSHGLTSSLLSNTAVRAGEILHSITAGCEPAAAPLPGHRGAGLAPTVH
jgi:L-ornithine N5-monooxygenase